MLMLGSILVQEGRAVGHRRRNRNVELRSYQPMLKTGEQRKMRAVPARRMQSLGEAVPSVNHSRIAYSASSITFSGSLLRIASGSFVALGTHWMLQLTIWFNVPDAGVAELVGIPLRRWFVHSSGNTLTLRELVCASVCEMDSCAPFRMVEFIVRKGQDQELPWNQENIKQEEQDHTFIIIRA
jgi:hypothetical protein